MLSIGVPERRARLVRRHRLDGTGSGAVSVARELVGLHATDPATVFLSARARIAEFSVSDLEQELYERHSLIKHLAMRRTLFVLPTDLADVVQGACTETLVAQQRARLAKNVLIGGLATDGVAWVEEAERVTLAALVDMGSATGQQLAKAVPMLQSKIAYGEGKSWGGGVGVATFVFTILAADRRMRRGRPTGGWTGSQHRWEPVERHDRVPQRPEATRELARAWLRTHGPATDADVAWWTGLGLTKARAALTALGAVAVDLEGELGFVLPDDLEPTAPGAPCAALLPALDPATMGWKGRDWYLGAHGPALFDRNGNAGPTVWWDGRVVGGWAQRKSGEVVYRLLEDIGGGAREAVELEVARLTEWIGPTVVSCRFPTPLQKELQQ